MSRFERPCFNAAALDGLTDEKANRLLFDWWCDDDDRPRYIASLKRAPTVIPSRAPRQDDPAPPVTERAPQGFRKIVLISDPDHVRQALRNSAEFSNVSYATLGGAAFLLAQDPGADSNGIDWHSEQQKFIAEALDYPAFGLRELARLAIEQAELVSLARPEFDLAQFAEQAALRYAGQLFGYGFQDHSVLEEASRATYRALQYLTIGQHFVSEPGTLPAAQLALGKLVARTSQLIEDYARLARSPRRHGYEPARSWPQGVQPWSELCLDRQLGTPLLRRVPDLQGPLSGRDRATVLATLLAGTLGNVQSAVCLLVQSLLDRGECGAVRGIADGPTLESKLALRLSMLPPVPVVPRRTRKGDAVTFEDGKVVAPDTDCLLLLQGMQGCPRVWGDTAGPGAPAAIHACLGRELAMPLVAALVQRVLQLPGLQPARDALTAEPLKLQRLWGFACTRYALVFERERVRAQQNLIVAMRVKPPISENAARLRRLIADAAPRVEHVLNGFGHVHFAWFEFTDDDSQLVLRTIYDGQFDAYIKHFALRAGDLFDGLFEFLEGAPARPVAEHPNDFVETIRRFNRAPLAGYLYSARPDLDAARASRCRSRP